MLNYYEKYYERCPRRANAIDNDSIQGKKNNIPIIFILKSIYSSSIFEIIGTDEKRSVS